jgi:hypothetical protein
MSSELGLETIVQTASIAAGFLGAGQIVSHHSFGLAAWIGVSAFGIVGLATAVVLWPRWQWKFTAAPKKMIASYLDASPAPSIADISRHAAIDLADGYDHNSSRLTKLSWIIAVACIFLVVEIISFLIGLGLGGS